MTDVLQEGDLDAEKRHVAARAETGVVRPQVQGLLELPEARRGRRDPPPGPSGGSLALPHLHLKLLAPEL